MDGRINYFEETRIEAARQFARGFGYHVVAKHLGLPVGTARIWHDSYLQGRLLHSEAVRENIIYPQDLKLAAVEKFLAGTPKAEIILEFGISTRSIFDRWVAAYRKDGPSGLVAKPKGRKPLVVGEESLEAKVHRLEMENALLKKFHALMTQESQAQPLKRTRSSH